MADPIAGIIASLKSESIIPDIIPDSLDFTPSVLFSIVWPSSDTRVVLGEVVSQPNTVDEPEIEVQPLLAPTWGAQTSESGTDSSDVKYTLVMTDPDAPSRKDPKYGQWRHWVITGIQLPAPNKSETDAVFARKTQAATTPYHPPGPPLGTGYHRYVFLLFQEPPSSAHPTTNSYIPHTAPEHNNEFTARRNWNATAFAEKYGLKLVGVNWFLCEAVAKAD